MVTQKDISAACGVSVSAVSKALSDYPDISEDTKQRVRDVAAKMGYQAARNEFNIKREHTYTAGLLITEETERESCRNVVSELRKTLTKRGYDLVLLSPEREKGKAAERPGYLPRARMFGMEGVFLFSQIRESDMYLQEDFKNLRELILGEIPVVAVGCFLAPCSCVLPGCEKGIRGLVSEVYRRGHRRIAFAFKESKDGCGDCCKAIRIALKEHRLEVPDHFLRCIRSGSAREAFAETMYLLQKNRWLRPTCILFADDMLLEGGIAAIRQCGFRIPEDICVAAIRISEEDGYQGIPVISWRIEPAKIAEAAVEQMFDGIGGLHQVRGRLRVIDGELYE